MLFSFGLILGLILEVENKKKNTGSKQKEVLIKKWKWRKTGMKIER